MIDMYQLELGSESMDLHTGAIPGDEAVPDGRMRRWVEVTLMRGRRRVYQSSISDGRRTDVTKAGFCTATEDQPWKGKQ